MAGMFAQLRERALPLKAAGLLIYGLLSFLVMYFVGVVVFDNVLFFRVFEFLWFAHILIICNQIQRSSAELILLALLALSPGMINNLLAIAAL
ncbi:MAG: hypothetical protein OHK0022_17330 [Roseiflexaceae bacterium]